jgi:hypothetical protein
MENPDTNKFRTKPRTARIVGMYLLGMKSNDFLIR